MLAPAVHNSLAPPGYNDIAWNELLVRFVEPFDSPDLRRLHLLERLQAYLFQVASLEIEVEVWLGGSWVSTKTSPNNVNLLLIFDRPALESLPPAYITRAKHLLDDRMQISATYECDVYWTTRNEQPLLAYWEDVFTTPDLPGGPVRSIFRLRLN